MFWLYVWGPLRPFHYPGGELLPPLPLLLAGFGLGLTVWWLPASYYQVRAFERTGRVYANLGVRYFRWFVPDGDVANRWRRRSDPSFRIIRNRHYARAFRQRTELSEKSHLMMLVFGVMSAGFAVAIGWPGWAIYLTVGNVLVNLYPILLQRYTRARLTVLLSRQQRTLSQSPTA